MSISTSLIETFGGAGEGHDWGAGDDAYTGEGEGIVAIVDVCEGVCV